MNVNKLKNVKNRSRPIFGFWFLLSGSIVLLISAISAISLGAADIDMKTVWEAVLKFNPDVQDHLIIWELRIPRVIGAAIVGCCFAVSGAIMQGMTRNPLADSGCLD